MQLIGQILGDRYRLEKKIGEGGMGQVFRARDIMTGEIVAVKILKEALSLKNTYLRRFKREIRSGSLVNHPGIVKLLDEGSIEGRPYLVMEYVEGQNLRQWAKNKRRSINLILEKFEGICKAIHNAHEKKLIHRDLKPENVLITYMGEVKIMDFGLARKINETSMITSPGTFIGTVVYTSPEQASGKKIDPRCDIYSIGIMLFEMLTGKLPFKGDDPIAVLFQHIHNDPPSVRELNKDVFPELEEFIARILSKDPEKRPQTAYETSREIKKLLNIMRGVSIEESEEILLQHASATPAGEDTELLPRKNYESTASTELKIEKLQGNMEVTFLLIELLDFINFTESLDYPTVQKFLDEYNHRLEDEILRYKVKVIQAGGHKSF
ncbi:MAG: serine/threonine protein kinase, partial [Vulcanimicrobiota bacterium]